MRSIIGIFSLCIMIFLSACGEKKQDGQSSGSDRNQEVSEIIAENVDVKEFSEMLESNVGGQLIDVRTPEEYMDGYINGAINLNIYDDLFEKNLDALDKNAPVYVYCKSGGRSANALDKMKEMGFKEIYNLSGGIMAWQESKEVVQ